MTASTAVDRRAGHLATIRQQLHSALAPQWLYMRVTEAKGTIGADEAIYVLITLSPHSDEWIKGRPSRAMSMVERRD